MSDVQRSFIPHFTIVISRQVSLIKWLFKQKLTQKLNTNNVDGEAWKMNISLFFFVKNCNLFYKKCYERTTEMISVSVGY